MASGSLPAGDQSSRSVRQGTLWFGLLGGAVAWLIHLVAAYLIAEFGCLTHFGEQRALGITLVSWMIVAVTAITALGGGSATWAAYRSFGRLRDARESVDTAAQRATARAGMYASGFSLLVILVETLPLLYYLRDC